MAAPASGMGPVGPCALGLLLLFVVVPPPRVAASVHRHPENQGISLTGSVGRPCPRGGRAAGDIALGASLSVPGLLLYVACLSLPLPHVHCLPFLLCLLPLPRIPCLPYLSRGSSVAPP